MDPIEYSPKKLAEIRQSLTDRFPDMPEEKADEFIRMLESMPPRIERDDRTRDAVKDYLTKLADEISEAGEPYLIIPRRFPSGVRKLWMVAGSPHEVDGGYEVPIGLGQTLRAKNREGEAKGVIQHFLPGWYLRVENNEVINPPTKEEFRLHALEEAVDHAYTLRALRLVDG